MEIVVARLTKYVAGLAAITLLCLGASHTALADAGPFSGSNGKFAVVKNSRDATFLGSLSPGAKFNPLYEAWDYDLAGSDLTFSPSGSRVALSVGWRPSRLAIIRVSRKKPRRILNYVDTRGLGVYEPFWAGNGRIVFTGWRERTHRSSTYSIRPNGKGLRKLFNRGSFAASRDLRKFVAARKGVFSHYLELLDRKGKRVKVLARNKKYFFPDPTISPNGRWIVYERYPDPPGRRDGDMQGDLFVVRSDGTHRRRLTRGTRDRFPTFSPDGRWIAFVRYNPGGNASNVAVLPLDRPGQIRRITQSGKKYTYYEEVAWGTRQAK